MGLSRPTRRAHTLGYVLRYGPVDVSVLRRDFAAAETFSDQMLQLAREQDLAMWAAVAEVFFAWAIAHQGGARDAVELAEHGAYNLAATRTALDHPNVMCLLAEIYAENARHCDAMRVLDEALDHAEGTGDCRYEAEAHRLKGRQLLALGSADAAGEAERSFLKSIEIAERQGALCWKLRSATDLARLWADAGERQKAVDLLVPVRAKYSETEEIPDVREATALLTELS